MMMRLPGFSLWSLTACVMLKSATTVAWISGQKLAYRPERNLQFIHLTRRRIADMKTLHQGIQGTSALSSSAIDDSIFVPDGFVPLVLMVALFLGFAANGWISQLLNGKDDKSGLGAFLKDGSGYNRSGFAMQDFDRAVQNDPLPWLKLPTFEFVEVAGQEKPEDSLERLRFDLNAAVENGDIIEAKRIERQLEDIMMTIGVKFQSGE